MRDKRIFKSHEEVAKSVTFNLEDTETCVYREQSPVDYFHKQKGVSSDDGKDCVAVVDPLYMLLNQKRIQSAQNLLGDQPIKDWFNSMLEHQSGDSLAELRKECSDEDLLALIKPRQIQHPSEIHSWANYMTSNMDYFKSEVKRVQEERIAAAKAEAEEAQKKVQTKGAE